MTSLEACDAAANLIGMHLLDDRMGLTVSVFAVAQQSSFSVQVTHILAEVVRSGAPPPFGAERVTIPNLGLDPELVREACRYAQSVVNIDTVSAAEVLDKWLANQSLPEHHLLIVTVLFILVGAAANTAEVKVCKATTGVSP